MSISIRSAHPGNDLAEIKKLLSACGLPDDVDPALRNFFVVVAEGKIVGCAGLEIYSGSGLARGLAVHSDHRQRGFGLGLLNKVEERARSLGLEEIYCITETAKDFLETNGFVKIDKEIAPEAMLVSPQFNGQCGEDAILMRMDL